MLVCFLRAGMAQERKTFGQPSRTVEQLAVELGAGATLEDLKDYVSSQHIAHEQKKSTLHLDELAYSRLLAALFPAGAVRWPMGTSFGLSVWRLARRDRCVYMSGLSDG